MSAEHAPPRRRRHKHGGGHDEEHENAERWLLTYADMITLLMVLFIVMFAISQVDQKKFAELKTGLASGFGGGANKILDGDTGVLQASGQTNQQIKVAPDIPAEPANTQVQAAVRDAVASADRTRLQNQLAAAQRAVEDFRRLQKQIVQALQRGKVAAGVRFRIDERGLVITIMTNSVVFAGDRADLLPEGGRILDAVGVPLRPLPNQIEVDGHTNQLPVPTRNYPSAWELSTARASTVVRYLGGRLGLAGSRLSAAGFAGERPLYPPSDPRAVTLNRRVEIVVLSTLPPEERALLPTASH
jgi:chemotaxis protein MotB